MRRAGLLVAALLATRVGAQEGALVTGIVFDSVARRPLEDATVQLLAGASGGTPRPLRSVRTDQEGRYYFDGVPRGAYLLGFLHPRLDSLQLETSLLRAEVPDSGSVFATLAIPSARTLVQASCLGATDDTGLFIGRARSAETHLPAADATVRVEWQTFTYLNRALQQHTRAATVRTSADGSFQLCGVPNSGLLRVRSSHGVEASGVVTLLVPPEGLIQRDIFTSTDQDTVVDADREKHEGASRWRGTLRGRTIRAEGTPVPRVRVRYADGLAEAVSNDEGYFAIADLPRGSATADFRALGYLPVILPVDVLGDDRGTTNFVLQTRAEYLDTVKVIATDVRDFNTGIAGFEQRKLRGIGHYFDKAEIDRIAPQDFTDLMRRVSGLTLLPSRNGPRLVMHGMGLQMFCAPAIFVNGSRASELDGTGLDALVNVMDLEGVEAYTRTGSMPAQFQTLDGCGAVVIWTKHRRGS